MARKNFKDNPALQFISEATDTKENTKNIHTDYTHNTVNTDSELSKSGRKESNTINNNSTKETKSKRLNLLVKPTNLNKLSKIAYMKQTSVNNLINKLIQSCIEENDDLINKYDNIF